MPIIRKVLEVGNSFAVTIPKSWLDFYEKETGQRIELVTMEVNKQLVISPYTPNKANAEITHGQSKTVEERGPSK